MHPKKSLGQNFLRNKNVLAKIISAAEIKVDDVILEVGPGEGILTQELARRAGFVLAIEKDARLAALLKQKFAEKKNVEIVEGDILQSEILNLKSKICNKVSGIGKCQYKIVANLPYYITSHFLRLYLEGQNKPELMVLMVQKEVAQRICAKNGQAADHCGCGAGQESLLSLSVKYYGQPHILAYVSRNSFFPVPKVDSAILKIEVFAAPRVKMADEKLFFWLMHATFASKRKQILGSLTRKLSLCAESPRCGVKKQISRQEVQKILENAHILPTARPENLGLTDWQKLTEIIHNSKFAPFV